jgi:DNA-binding PadR family transcriptional regulator
VSRPSSDARRAAEPGRRTGVPRRAYQPPPGLALSVVIVALVALGATQPMIASGLSASRLYTCYAYIVAHMSERALRAPAFLVLTALAAEPQHGYGVIADVLRISDGTVRLHTGTLYAVLDRLREEGLIEVDREEIVASRLRRYYRLTGAGAARLASETAQMQRNAGVAAGRLRRLRHAGEAGAL